MLNLKKLYLQINTADPQIFLWFGLSEGLSMCGVWYNFWKELIGALIGELDALTFLYWWIYKFLALLFGKRIQFSAHLFAFNLQLRIWFMLIYWNLNWIDVVEWWKLACQQQKYHFTSREWKP